MPKGYGEDKIRIGRSQARRVRENPPEAPFGTRLSNKDRLKLSKAAAKNLVEGTMEKNRAIQRSNKVKKVK